MLLSVSLLLCHLGFLGTCHELKMVFDPECSAQSPALSKHHYLVRPSFSVPLAVLGQGGGGGYFWSCPWSRGGSQKSDTLRGFGNPRFLKIVRGGFLRVFLTQAHHLRENVFW